MRRSQYIAALTAGICMLGSLSACGSSGSSSGGGNDQPATWAAVTEATTEEPTKDYNELLYQGELADLYFYGYEEVRDGYALNICGVNKSDYFLEVRIKVRINGYDILLAGDYSYLEEG